MRPGTIMKGFCYRCRAYRAFQVQETRTEHITVHIMGKTVGHVQPLRTRYRGTCSHGHEEEFTPIEINQSRMKYPPKRTPPAKYFNLRVREQIIPLRSAAAVEGYRAWLEQFRDPGREEHYRKGHRCGPRCPEYERDWEPEDWD